MLFALLIVAPAGVLRAQSQEPSTDEETARVLFDEAAEAYRDGHLVEARRLLLRSLQLSPRASSALNLAQVQRTMGLPVDAEETLLRILDGTYGIGAESRSERVRQALEEVRRRQARLVVVLRGTAGGQLLLDGEPAGDIGPNDPRPLPANPGPHRVEVITTTGERQSTRIEAAAGERTRGELVLLSNAAPPEPTQPPERHASRAWLWATLGVVAAGTIAGIVLWRAMDSPDPVTDPVFPTATALRWQ